jgi:hypothetical protein
MAIVSLLAGNEPSGLSQKLHSEVLSVEYVITQQREEINTALHRVALKAHTRGALPPEMNAVLEDARRRVDARLDQVLSRPKRQRWRKAQGQVLEEEIIEPVDRPTAQGPNRGIYFEAPENIEREFARISKQFLALARAYSTASTRYVIALSRARCAP